MLDASGFKRMRYSDLLEQMEEQARAKYGENVNTSALSPLGIILRIFAFFLAYVWQGVEHVYYAAYRDTATGVSLDRLAPQVGIKRFQEELAYGEIAFVGTPEYTIPEGTIVGTAIGKYFATNEDLTLDNDGKGSVGITAQKAGSGWNVASGTITVLLNPDANIISVTNPRPTTGGRERETDEEFRARFQQSVAGGGAASVDALRGTLLRLQGVRAAAVIENTSLTTDAAGRPGKSFQCYVLGGDEQEIANAIFATKAGGIEAHGDIVREVTDVAGYKHKVKFSRAEEVVVSVQAKIKRTVQYPADGDDKVISEIVQHIGGEHDGKYYNGLSMGAAVVYNKLISAVYKVPGVDDVDLFLNGDTKNIEIAPHQVARIRDQNIVFSLKDMMSRFTDAYNKNPNSNLGKLVSILHGQLIGLEDTLNKIQEWRDIDRAQGTTLDRIGENVVQPRGAATDEVYRILLKSKVARNLSKTDVNTIIEVLALALDCDFSEIRIEEKYADPNEPEPAALSLLRVPIARLNEVGMSPYQFAQIIQKTVAAGVRVAQIDLSGTFLLASKRAEVEKSKFGLADIAMTTGGTLGTVYMPGNDYELPI